MAKPLFYFLLLGAGLFLVLALFCKSETEPEPGSDGSGPKIVVTASRIEQLVIGFADDRQRPPTPEELNGLIEEHIREEIRAREVLRTGRDPDDLVGAAFVEPTDQELEEFLEANPAAFRSPNRYSFEQVLARGGGDPEATRKRATELLTQLQAGGSEIDVTQLGDRTPLPPDFEWVTADDLNLQLGPRFAAGLDELSVNSWAGPVESDHGLHLVWIRERVRGGHPDLDEIRPAVELAWQEARREEMAEAIHEKLRERYSIVIEKRR